MAPGAARLKGVATDTRNRHMACALKQNYGNYIYMKQYVIDQLRLPDYRKLKRHFDENLEKSTISGIYWLTVDNQLLTQTQAKHHECRPFFFALELEENRLSCELLVRTQQKIRCDCIRYADAQQRTWLLEIVDGILEKLDISV